LELEESRMVVGRQPRCRNRCSGSVGLVCPSLKLYTLFFSEQFPLRLHHLALGLFPPGPDPVRQSNPLTAVLRLLLWSRQTSETTRHSPPATSLRSGFTRCLVTDATIAMWSRSRQTSRPTRCTRHTLIEHLKTLSIATGQTCRCPLPASSSDTEKHEQALFKRRSRLLAWPEQFPRVYQVPVERDPLRTSFEPR
jgi:hypothetical protein